MTSLYERLGGEAAIFAVVDGLYQRIIGDELLRGFFDDTDMNAQSRKMTGFLAHAFGGPQELKGRNLREAHAGLVTRGLGDAHFDAVVGHLRAALVEVGVPADLVAEVLAVAESTRGAVLGRGDA